MEKINSKSILRRYDDTYQLVITSLTNIQLSLPKGFGKKIKKKFRLS